MLQGSPTLVLKSPNMNTGVVLERVTASQELKSSKPEKAAGGNGPRTGGGEQR